MTALSSCNWIDQFRIRPMTGECSCWVDKGATRELIFDCSGATGLGSTQEARRFQLGGDLLDGLLDIRRPPGAGADELAAPEQEVDDLRFVDAVHQAGELLRCVLRPAEDAGDRLEIELFPEGSRCDDVFDRDLRRKNHHGPEAWIPARRLRPNPGSPLYS